MTQSLIFARVQPKSIKLTEKYTYHIEVDPINDQIVQDDESPQGRLEINIPYDGETHITPQTFQDVKRQIQLFTKQQNTTIRVGYLSFSNHSHSTIIDGLEVNSSDVLPLDISVNAKELEDAHKVSKLFPCQFNHEYTPEWPDVIPIQLRIDISDEVDIPNKVERWLGDLSKWKLTQETADSIEKLFAEHMQFNRVLIFYFKFTLAIPYQFGTKKQQKSLLCNNAKSEDKELNEDTNQFQDNDEQQICERIPQIARLTLQWPKEISHRAVTLHIGKMTKRRVCDPKKNIIEWHDINLIPPNTVSSGTDLYHYDAPTIRLFVVQPGELYRKQYIEGEIEVKIPCAISGIELNYFNVLGKNKSEILEHQTVLLTKFQLFLKPNFDQKRYLPNQQLEFAGVILNELRIIDIQNVLLDIGFKVEIIKVVKDTFYFINGEKGDKPEQIKLWIIIKGKVTQTIRERSIPGKHTFKTVLETGHTTINMCGRIKGDHKGLLESMNSIHNRLKEQFYHISTVD